MQPRNLTTRPARWPATKAQSNSFQFGFTLTELAAAAAAAAMLAVAGLPASALRTKATAQQTVCLNNHQQMARAWFMYAEDHANQVSTCYKWISLDSLMGYFDNYPSNTNINDLMDGQLGPYLKGPGVFRCPTDRTMAVEGTAMLPRVRSISMSQAICLPTDGTWVVDPPWNNYYKTTQITNPTPANLWVFIDENPDSINDGAFAVDMSNSHFQAAFQDGPSVLHNNGCTLSFADGHAEAHPWTDPRTISYNNPTYTLGYYYGRQIPNDLDVAWLEFHTSANNNGTPGW